MNVLARVLAALRAIAAVALFAMMLVTIIDVAMRIVLNELVLGAVELVQFALVATVFLALPDTLLRGEHITVDVIDQSLSPKALGRLRRIAAIATALLAVVLAWRTIPPALDTIEIGDLTTDLQISLVWYWLPLVVGAVAGAAAAVVFAMREFGDRPDGGADVASDGASADGSADGSGGAPAGDPRGSSNGASNGVSAGGPDAQSRGGSAGGPRGGSAGGPRGGSAAVSGAGHASARRED